jgi:hypothetical protein
MKNAMMLLGVLLLSTSCLTIDGRLVVSEAFTVKKKSGFLNLKTKEQLVAANSYSASLKVKSDKNYNLELKGGSLGEIQIPIKAESNLNMPYDGAFNISHEKINQPFDISGVIDTDVSEYGYTDTVESCTWNVTEKKCDKVLIKETGKYDIICKDEITTFHGRRDISYHYRQVVRDLSLDFMKAGSTGVIAHFTGRNQDTDKITDHYSECR